MSVIHRAPRTYVCAHVDQEAQQIVLGASATTVMRSTPTTAAGAGERAVAYRIDLFSAAFVFRGTVRGLQPYIDRETRTGWDPGSRAS